MARTLHPARATWLALLSFGVMIGMVPRISAESRVVDFRYGIPTWLQPLGIPGDWHKPLATERGALMYDFGPGPYVQGTTVVEASAEGAPLTFVNQEFTESSRLPFLRTHLKAGSDAVTVTTFSIAPEKPAISEGRSKAYERLDGITGAESWAKPPATVSPEFRNTAWGITRPIRYRVRVKKGEAKIIMLGFCESYKLILNQRIAEMHVEGAAPLVIDIPLNGPVNQPQVFLFNARDADGDGWIDLSVFAPQGHDPNVALSTIAVYAAGTKLSREELLAGSLHKDDRAELRIACGTEMSRQAARVDMIHAQYQGSVQPAFTVKTGRDLAFNDEGVLVQGKTPFLTTLPRATKAEQTETGWKLQFPAGTRIVTAYVFSGDTNLSDTKRAVKQNFEAAYRQTRERWSKYSIPFGRITVADPAIQAMIDASIRNLYQGLESINGQMQFNSSFSLYRGLWAGDAVYMTMLAAQLGDSASARQTLDALFSHQLPNGIIDELHPQQIYRTTAEVIWGVERDAQISGDWSYARKKWPQIALGVKGIQSLREQTLSHPDAPYYGMLPPGFSDGGILDIGSEYSSVYCMITGLKAAVRMAKVLGYKEDAAAFDKLANEFLTAFDRNRQRDQRRDRHGNLYLPVRVGYKGEDPIPQLTQWAAMDSHLYGGGWLSSDHELVKGTLALLESVEKQGIPVSMGWMPGGNWAGMGMFYGFQFLILDRPEKTADIVYAVANHASRVGTWVEEQSLVGEPLRLAGDQPHGFASTMMPQITGSMLAYERMDIIHLLAAVPEEWLRAGAVNRLENWHTGAGKVTLSLTVSSDGKTATLAVDPIVRADKNPKIVLHTASLKKAGFEVNSTADRGRIELTPGKAFQQTFLRK